MIIQNKNGIVIEAIRHEEDLDMRNHFIGDCGWLEPQFEEIEHFDFYCVEIKATNEKLESSSAYLGACCNISFEEDVKSNIGGYLPQMIAEAIEGL